MRDKYDDSRIDEQEHTPQLLYYISRFDAITGFKLCFEILFGKYQAAKEEYICFEEA